MSLLLCVFVLCCDCMHARASAGDCYAARASAGDCYTAKVTFNTHNFVVTARLYYWVLSPSTPEDE